MSLTGFTMPDGRDLSVVFEPYTSPDAKADETGFTVFRSDLDLNSVFKKNTSNTYIANDTNYIAPSGLDLRYIFEPLTPLIVTITGTGDYSTVITGNTYTYTFVLGTNTISINKNIPALYAIVCGGGGGGRSNNNGINYSGGGGAGGGFGFVQINYKANTVYNTSVAASVNQNTNGQNTTFKNGANGVVGYGGAAGPVIDSQTQAISGTCAEVGTTSIGTLTWNYGGNGGQGKTVTGALSATNGENSSVPRISVLGITYNYGGGGGGGAGTAPTGGGGAGNNGNGGAVRGSSTVNGANANANAPGAGGGGGSFSLTFTNGGRGGPGIIIVTFQYP
jgi:hypothetical protein